MDTSKQTFKIKDWILKHPHNQDVVDNLVAEITEYVKSHYPKKSKTFPFSDWYCGISNDPENARTAGHKNRKQISELKNHKAFYAYSLSNARKIEQAICTIWGLGICSIYGGVKQNSKWVYVYNLSNSPTQ
jgi:hypothetical protein